MRNRFPHDGRRAALRVLALTASAWHLRGLAATESVPALRIGFQKGSPNLVLLKLSGDLERRLPGTRVTWAEFPAGPQLLEALAVGSVDVGATGDSPPVFAQAAGKDIVYVAAEPPKPDSSAILVRPDGPLRTPADLRGRRVALQKGSSAHYLLVRAVTKAGLQWSDIQPVYLPPADARAAFERDAVDAWAIWDPYYAAAEIDGRARVLATSRGLTDNGTFYLASSVAAARAGAPLRALFDALAETDAQARRDRADAARRYAAFAGLDRAVVHRMLERRPPSPPGPLTPAVVAEQQRVADAFARLGLIPAPIRVADIVAPAARSLALAR